MLLGILALYFYNFKVTGVLTFSIPDLQKLALPWEYQFWLFLAFFFGFAIKVPMFPFPYVGCPTPTWRHQRPVESFWRVFS